MVKAAAGGSGSDNSIVDQLHALGVEKGVIVQMAKRGQLRSLDGSPLTLR